MSRGSVDGTVVDRVRGQKLLTRMLALVKPGSAVRVTSKAIRVDRYENRVYNQIQRVPGEGRGR